VYRQVNKHMCTDKDTQISFNTAVILLFKVIYCKTNKQTTVDLVNITFLFTGI